MNLKGGLNLMVWLVGPDYLKKCLFLIDWVCDLRSRGCYKIYEICH